MYIYIYINKMYTHIHIHNSSIHIYNSEVQTGLCCGIRCCCCCCCCWSGRVCAQSHGRAPRLRGTPPPSAPDPPTHPPSVSLAMCVCVCVWCVDERTPADELCTIWGCSCAIWVFFSLCVSRFLALCVSVCLFVPISLILPCSSYISHSLSFSSSLFLSSKWWLE